MSGNRTGGLKAAKKNMRNHGRGFYKRIGKLGGSVKHPETRHFFVDREMARTAGAKGGTKSTRLGIKNRRKGWRKVLLGVK